MYDIEPQTADGKVLWHFGMSLDGYVAGPNVFDRGGAVGGCAGPVTGGVVVVDRYWE